MKKDLNAAVQVVIPYEQSDVNAERVMLLLGSMVVNADFRIQPVFVGDKVDGFPHIPFAPDCSHDIPGAIVTAVHSEMIDGLFLVASPKFMMLNKAPLAYFAIPLLHPAQTDKYDIRFPMLVEKDHMAGVLEAISAGLYEPDADALKLYHDRYCEVALDLDWQASPFLLPVISEHPHVDTFLKFAEKKVGAYIEHDAAFEDLALYAMEQVGVDLHDLVDVVDVLKDNSEASESAQPEPEATEAPATEAPATEAPATEPEEEAEEEETEQPEPEATEAENKD